MRGPNTWLRCGQPYIDLLFEPTRREKYLLKGIVWELPVVTKGEGEGPMVQWEGEQNAWKQVPSREVMGNTSPLQLWSQKISPIWGEEEGKRAFVLDLSSLKTNKTWWHGFKDSKSDWILCNPLDGIWQNWVWGTCRRRLGIKLSLGFWLECHRWVADGAQKESQQSQLQGKGGVWLKGVGVGWLWGPLQTLGTGT